ncbi:hypothetical protein [uncultured Cutibacterium sp.]|uniref:hypothetical protein n=1 Tax=uncultured Cutibacterium sp. TaxID=1912223 RepID=UPI0025963BE7|nr:hypothetical protein [uncultured Cutibacterium sp.]
MLSALGSPVAVSVGLTIGVLEGAAIMVLVTLECHCHADEHGQWLVWPPSW